jgi:hypothetical protein
MRCTLLPIPIRRLLPGLAVIMAILTAANVASAATSLFAEDRAIEQAVAAIEDKAGGGHLRALQIEIEPDAVTIQLQDPQDPRHVNEWKFARIDLRLFQYDRVSGPQPVELNLINPDLEANLFNLDDVDFAASDKLMKAAIARAALEDPARVFGMEIKRQVIILPRPSSGPVLWRLDIGSGRETAQIIADAGGRIIGWNLDGTNRAKNLDILQQLALTADAARDFKAALGSDRVLLKVDVNSRDIGFDTNLPEAEAGADRHSTIHHDKDFVWNLNGLRRTLAGSVHVDVPGMQFSHAPFGIDEADWGLLPKLPAKARDALGMPQGRVSDITLSKPTQGVGTPILLWKIEVTDRNGEKGMVLADTAGALKQVLLPESRRKPINWLDPSAIVDGFARIQQEFGNGAKFAELSFSKDKVSIIAQDPRQPGQVSNFFLTDKGFDRFGGAFAAFAMMHAQDRPFAIGDLASLTAAKIAELEGRTMAQMHLANIQVTDVTIGRANMDPSPQGNVVVEIRALVPPFNAPMPPGGRVVYELDGRVIKAYLP